MTKSSLEGLVLFEIPILKSITRHYEKQGLSHIDAELKAVETASAELRRIYDTANEEQLEFTMPYIGEQLSLYRDPK